MCAAQVLANLFLQRLELGELVVYRGNALGPTSGLSVVIHTTVADLTPDLVLPALHPSRVAALRVVVEAQGGSTDRTACDLAPSAGLTKQAVREYRDQAHGPEVDLFAGC